MACCVRSNEPLIPIGAELTKPVAFMWCDGIIGIDVMTSVAPVSLEPWHGTDIMSGVPEWLGRRNGSCIMSGVLRWLRGR